MSRHYQKRETKGHGALGFILTFIVIIVIIGAAIFFFTGGMNGIKSKVYSIFYPQSYSEQVSANAAEFSVDEALVYAVMRTESGFRPEVESHAGAVGLMQLMPETFEWLQNRLDGEVKYTAEDLKNPDVNIRYGTYFLSLLIPQYDGDVRTIAAAYNAGTAAVDSWLSDSQYSSDGKHLSTIPYTETSNYADKVASTFEMYKQLYYDNN